MGGFHSHSHGHHNSHSMEEKSRLVKLATWASLSVALILVATKLFAWIMSDSVSLLSSLIDSSMDFVISGINFLAVRYAHMPPDEDHKFGHTAAEDIAALAQAAFIGGSAVFIMFTAIHGVIHPRPLGHSDLAINVMILSIVLTSLLVLFQKFVAAKTKSPAISADSLHYFSDLLTNAAVIIAIILTINFGWTYADPILGFIMGAYILYGALHIGKKAFDNMMDKEMPEEERKQIEEFVLSCQGVNGMHALKTRYSGIKPFIQMHLEMDGDKTLRETHAIADRVEKNLAGMFEGSEVIIHQDFRDDQPDHSTS
jgi:ferrous-iron efflux pump FieF